MTHTTIRIPLLALTLVGAAACGGGPSNPPPQTPADQTTTTGANAATPEPQAAMAPMPSSDPVPSSTSNLGTNTNPSGLHSPLDTTAGTSLSAGAAGAGAPAAGGDSASLSDGQIVAVIQTADQGEIAQAREAIRKGKNARVKQFAQHMVTDHSAAETKLATLDSSAGITPQENSVTAQLKSGGDQIMGNLKSASGSDFDKAYIDAQVSEHTQVLSLLDERLIPHAQNADLTKTLQAIRTKVAGHLKMAQDIQSALTMTK
jgi:putative membrane protein